MLKIIFTGAFIFCAALAGAEDVRIGVGPSVKFSPATVSRADALVRKSDKG